MTPRSRLKRLSILPTGLVWKKDSGDRMTRSAVWSWMCVEARTAEKKKMAERGQAAARTMPTNIP